MIHTQAGVNNYVY